MKNNYDVIVVGGGIGGCCAGIASAKQGASTLLVERYGFLGGMATAGLVNPFMGYALNGKYLTSAIFNEMISRLKKKNAIAQNECVFDDEILKVVLDEMMRDYGVEALFHSVLADVKTVNGKIEKVFLEGKSGRVELNAKIFVDSTGDGDLASRAGAEVEVGRSKDGLCQPMTLNFRIGGVTGNPDIAEVRRKLNEIFTGAKERGEINQPRENILMFPTLVPGVFHFNTTRVVGKSAIDVFQLSEAETEGRRQAMELFELFKKHCPEFKDCYLLKTGCQIGIRESRRVMGLYVLTEDDVISARKFNDGIARSCYPVDIHNPAGSGTIIKTVRKDDYYEIPYRCVVPRGIQNLLIGSRCISATHEAHSSLRIMPVVAGIGEGAGHSAGKSAKTGVLPKDISGEEMKRDILG